SAHTKNTKHTRGSRQASYHAKRRRFTRFDACQERALSIQSKTIRAGVVLRANTIRLPEKWPLRSPKSVAESPRTRELNKLANKLPAVSAKVCARHPVSRVRPWPGRLPSAKAAAPSGKGKS